MSHVPAAAPPQLSPDGRWWWDGQRWQPVPQPGSAPGLGHAPGPGYAAGHGYGYAPAPQGRSTGRTVAIVLLCVVGVPVLLGIVLAVAIPVYLNQRDKAQEADVRSALVQASIAQETYALENGTYTVYVEDLIPYGFEFTEGVDLWPISADATSYCLGAGPAAEWPVL